MKLKISEIISNSTFKNGIWLYIFQIFNLIIPLITLPYITRVLGKETYGVFSASLNIIMYLNVIVAYGFDLIGAKKASTSKDRNELQTIYSSIFTIKLWLLILSFIVMLILVLVFKIPHHDFLIMFALFLLVIGNMLQQVWLFHGIQLMKIQTLANIVFKSISVALVFLIVNNSNHLLLYSFLYASTFFLTGIFSHIYIRYFIGLEIKKIEFIQIKEYLIEGLPTFFTSIASSIYSGVGITILVIFSTDDIVGGYSAILKIPGIIISLFTPILQALFPLISKYYSISLKKGFSVLKTAIIFIMPLIILAFIIMAILSKTIVEIIFGNEYLEFSWLLYPFGVWMIFGILNNLLGIQGLVASGNQKLYSKSFFIGVITVLVLSITLGYYFNVLGVAMATMISEITLSISILINIIRRKNYEKSNGSIRD